MSKQVFLAFALAVFGMAGTATASGLTVTEAGGLVTVDGTDDADHIVLESWVAGTFNVIDVAAGYEVCATFNLADIDTVMVSGLGGADLIENRDINVVFLAFGDAGNDCILGANLDSSFDEINGGAGDDFIFGGRGTELLLGEAGNDTIWGSDFNFDDSIGSSLVGGDGNDTIFGAPQDDVIVVGDDGSVDFVDCIGGNDFASPFASRDADDHIVNCD